MLYELVDLGTLAGHNQSSTTGVNNHNDVVGTSAGNGTFHGVLWKNGHELIDLGMIGPYEKGFYPEAINDLGEIVGMVPTVEGGEQAVRWKDGTLHLLPGLGGIRSRAKAINNRGEIVGWAEAKDGALHAVQWANGVVNELKMPGNFSNGTAFGINDRGQIVGNVGVAGSEIIHAFLWDNGNVASLGTLQGHNDSYAYAINEDGWVVGASRVDLYQRNGFLWYIGHMSLTDMPGMEYVIGRSINQQGYFSGEALQRFPHPAVRAFVCQNGFTIDIGTLGGMRAAASGINDHNYVIGWSETDRGDVHAFLALPESNE
jgi:probable HAF family extracellular repeat protein